MHLKQIIEQTETKSGRILDLSIHALIVLSLIVFSIETLPELSPATRKILRYIEVISVAVFTAEYIARLAVADEKIKFITSFFGVIDLLAILPFYLSFGVDLRCVRAFRLLRLVRVLKLARYNSALCRFHRALIIAKEELILFGAVSLILLYLSAVGTYHFENAVQEAVAGMSFYECHRCAVVTNSRFPSSAVALAEANNCICIGEENFVDFIYGKVLPRYGREAS